MSKPKSDIWMPIYIGDLLADTQHLTNEQFGAYHKLLYHQWRSGHFSEDELEAICGFSGPAFNAASSTFQAELKQVFSRLVAPIKQMLSKDSEGRWFSPRCDREKLQWSEKKRVFTERAKKGGIGKEKRRRERIEKEEQEKAASSTPQALLEGMLDGCTSPLPIEEHLPTPTPPSERVGSVTTITPRQAGRSPRQTGTAPRQRGISPRQIESENKAKRGANGHLSDWLRPDDREGPKIYSSASSTVRGANGEDSNEGNESPKDNSLWCELKGEVLAYMAGQNPDDPEYTWTDADDRALDALISRRRNVSVAWLQNLLRNRAHSEVNPAAAPYKWLRSIAEFSSGPLGKFSKPIHARTV